MTLINYNTLLIFIILFGYSLNQWILPPFYSWFNTKLDYNIYSGDLSEHPTKNFTTKGYMLNGIIIQSIITFIGVIGFLYDYIPILFIVSGLIGFLWIFLGGYLRSDKFRISKDSKNDSLNLENKKYYFNYYLLLNFIPTLLFTEIGLVMLISKYMITFTLITGICLQTLLWFPDKLNKIWPWDLRTKKGIITLTISIILITIILIKYIVIPEYIFFTKIFTIN